jgi:hypothetical protein
MTLFGVEPEVTLLRWGKEKTREAQAYMQRAVQYVKDLIESENLDSDYEHTGMLRVSYTDKQVRRLKKPMSYYLTSPSQGALNTTMAKKYESD